MPSIYFAHTRDVFERDGMLYAVSPFMELMDGEEAFTATVRYRTVGDMSCTGAVESDAATLPEIIQEMLLTKTSERQGRLIDHDQAGSMEEKKKEGYF